VLIGLGLGVKFYLTSNPMKLLINASYTLFPIIFHHLFLNFNSDNEIDDNGQSQMVTSSKSYLTLTILDLREVCAPTKTLITIFF
jgi:hypothetical protein